MSLAPKFAAHRLTFGAPASSSSSSVPPATHTMEVFVDYTCPFSAKIYRAIQDVVDPLVRGNSAWASNLNIILRQQVQPWHPSSTLVHESAIAVLQLTPEKFWAYSRLLFDEQTAFYDVNVVNETRNQTYRRLAKLAAKAGVDEEQVYKKLEIPDKPASDGSLNVGNAVTNDLKVITKVNRLVGVHVTPTVIYDGVVQNDISSGWTGDQWKEWLTKNVV